MEEINIEKRRHTRYSAKHGAYAAIGPLPSKIGQIINISIGGLLFEYMENGNEEGDGLNEILLLLGGHGFFVEEIGFSTIDDYSIPNSTSFSSIKMRKTRLSFENLSIQQFSDLGYYIQNNTIPSSKKN